MRRRHDAGVTPEIARIVRSFSPQERALWRSIGGRIPPGTPKPLIIWRSRDVLWWTARDAKPKKGKEA